MTSRKWSERLESSVHTDVEEGRDSTGHQPQVCYRHSLTTRVLGKLTPQPWGPGRLWALQRPHPCASGQGCKFPPQVMRYHHGLVQPPQAGGRHKERIWLVPRNEQECGRKQNTWGQRKFCGQIMYVNSETQVTEILFLQNFQNFFNMLMAYTNGIGYPYISPTYLMAHPFSQSFIRMNKAQNSLGTAAGSVELVLPDEGASMRPGLLC